MRPLLSVVIPNYNHAPFLKQRIESVLYQTFQDFEVIILDDCSTDHSRDIIERYRQHPKVSTVIFNDLNSGNTFKQWAKGIEQARGEWIWIAESDDWCEPTFLEEVLPNQENPDSEHIVLSYCGSVMFRDNNILSYPAIKYVNQILEGDAYVKMYMTRANSLINASSCIFRREAYSNSPTNNQFILCGDWFTWINIALQGSVKVSGRCLNYFRKHSGDISGISHNNGTFHLEYLVIQNFLLDKNIIKPKEFENNLLKNYSMIKKIVRKNDTNKVIIEYNNYLSYFKIFLFFIKKYIYKLNYIYK
jgi:glycosyltransferase involved in cell wall biosynthesis